MAISTNSIIHYTDSFTKLEAILKEGFAIKYCSEKLKIDGGLGSFAAHPMISFCDIPLSQSYKHFDAYGRYGIGLSKSWANGLGINPVLYIDSSSSIGKTLATLIADRRGSSSNLTETQKNNILRIKCFTKNYSGHLVRNNIDDENYRFYDEREWRLVPQRNEIYGAPFSLRLDLYESDKAKFNDAISSIRFLFTHADISYIIVDNTKEVVKLVNFLRSEYSTKCTAQELDILFSKICTTEQIINDY